MKAFKYVNKELFITFNGAIECGFTAHAIKKAKQRKSASWQFIDDPDDRRATLIHFESLKEQYKALVKAKYGNPYDYIASEALNDRLILLDADRDYIDEYRDANGNLLKDEVAQKYKQECRYLNMIASLRKKDINDLGFKSVKHDFYPAVIHMLKNDDLVTSQFPKSYGRLRKKVKEYKENGPAAVISKMLGNQVARKVDDIGQDVLLKMIGHHHKFSSEFIAQRYNDFVRKYNYDNASDLQHISASTVTHYRRKYAFELDLEREGMGAWHSKHGRIIHRRRPSAPLYLINSDDNDLDLYFKIKSKYYNRITLLVVIDAFNDYPLGYAIGESQTVDLVKEAYLDAIHHIKELTGGFHIWHELKVDHWGMKALRKWYEEQAVFTPAQARNSRGKVIEQSFGQKWHGVLKQYINYAGHNITSKGQVNREELVRNRRDFPDISDAPKQVAHFISQMRQLPGKSGKSRQQEWVEAWHDNNTEKRELTDRRRIMLFGRKHKDTNRLTNAGIQATLNGEKITFDIDPVSYRQHAGKKFQLYYDPRDVSKCLATADEGKVKLMLQEYRKNAHNVKDLQPGERNIIQKRMDEQKAISQYVLKRLSGRDKRLLESGIDPESLLMTGELNKELKQAAEHKYLEEQIEKPEQPEAGDIYDDDLLFEEAQANNKINNQQPDQFDDGY